MPKRKRPKDAGKKAPPKDASAAAEPEPVLSAELAAALGDVGGAALVMPGKKKQKAKNSKNKQSNLITEANMTRQERRLSKSKLRKIAKLEVCEHEVT